MSFMLNKLKPCKCGCEVIDCNAVKAGAIWVAYAVCTSLECQIEPVMAVGLSKQGAIKKAKKAWNRSNK